MTFIRRDALGEMPAFGSLPSLGKLPGSRQDAGFRQTCILRTWNFLRFFLEIFPGGEMGWCVDSSFVSSGLVICGCAFIYHPTW